MEWTVSTFVSLLAALIPFAAIAYQFYNPPSVASIDEANEADPEVVNPVVVEFSGVDRCQSWKPELVRSESETKYYY